MSSLARHVHTSTAYHLQLSHKTNTLVISYRTAADCFPFGPGPDAQPHCTTCPGDCNHRGCNSCPAHLSSSPRWRCCSIRPSRRIVWVSWALSAVPQLCRSGRNHHCSCWSGTCDYDNCFVETMRIVCNKFDSSNYLVPVVCAVLRRCCNSTANKFNQMYRSATLPCPCVGFNLAFPVNSLT